MAIAARVPDSVLALLLNEGCVMRQVDLIKAKLAEEWLNVVEMNEFVWVTLGKFIDRNGSYVRDRALSTAWISAGHIRTTIVDVAERPPWSPSQPRPKDRSLHPHAP